MKTHYTVKVQLTLIGPILTAGGETAEPGIDAPMARDRHGRWMLPFSLIKGKFLDAVSELRASEFQRHPKLPRYVPGGNSKLTDWLGLPSADGGFDPERGRLRFSDFVTTRTGNPDNIIERIQLDPEAGAVKGRMLLMVQAPFGNGEEVTFEGTVEFVADAQEAIEIRKLIDEALRWVPAYGAYRTVGFGRTKQVTVALHPTESRISGTQSPGEVLPFELKLDRPLCLVGRRHSQNHFESEECISGTVLKGAIAQMLQEIEGLNGRDVSIGTVLPNLRRHFSAIRVTEARPRAATSASRSVEPPLSIARCPIESQEERYFDAALEEHARLIDGAAPAFRPDWKEKDFVLVFGAFGRPMVPRERRTRTAIDPDKGRAADEQLFSYGLVLPDRTDANGKKIEFVWDGCIGLKDVPEADRDAVARELAELLRCGLFGIGKTRAVGEVTWKSAPPEPAVTSAEWSGNEVVITLQTDCLMTNPDTLRRTNLADPLKEAYCEFWMNVSDKTLTLTRFFARQSLYGGFVSQRAKQAGAGKYEPFLLTDRGSVFVLRINNEAKAKSLIDDWNRHALPQPDWVATRYGEPLWKRCPYIRENGYGEIAVNLKCHFDTDNRFPPQNASTGAQT